MKTGQWNVGGRAKIVVRAKNFEESARSFAKWEREVKEIRKREVERKTGLLKDLVSCTKVSS